jgi:hypothetical protein
MTSIIGHFSGKNIARRARLSEATREKAVRLLELLNENMLYNAELLVAEGAKAAVAEAVGALARDIARHVGWTDPSGPPQHFVTYVGVIPIEILCKAGRSGQDTTGTRNQ